MLLFNVPTSPFGARIRIQAAAKRLALEVVDPPGGLGSPEFFAINPFGKVPVLRTEDGDIYESAVIQEYLEDRFPNTSLRGANPPQAAAVRTFVRAVDLYLFPALFRLRSADPIQLHAAATVVDELKVVVDRLARLKAGPLLCGSLLTLADCALAPAYFYTDLFARRLGLTSPFDHHPSFTTWWADVNERDEMQSVIAELTRATQARRKDAND